MISCCVKFWDKEFWIIGTSCATIACRHAWQLSLFYHWSKWGFRCQNQSIKL
ncbi:hypothetical protein RchiOBHm_Chr1g0334931 [Rosa chinensis]|uniref:Uncharacterized protein n=1 Tax=Rosa chinensis TaxID=74649 RepID=A0A2P6SCF2_ROSCH|nr:hypothetical protein RchiOBHm_Chr1g0334931 [Rosa chinensis]